MKTIEVSEITYKQLKNLKQKLDSKGLYTYSFDNIVSEGVYAIKAIEKTENIKGVSIPLLK